MNNGFLKITEETRKIVFILLFAGSLIAPFIDPPIALLLGLATALVLGNPFIALNKKATTLLLQISVVCLGFNMNFEHAMQAGQQGLLFTIFTIAITLAAGWWIGKQLKIERNTSMLISNGTAICGGSAIAAIAPIIKANDQQISVSLATIFLLNSIALLIFPPLGHLLRLSDQQFGTWCAIAIHDTSSVVGAANKYSEKAVEIATTIKLERALWIIPLSLITSYFQKSKGKIKIPYFIFYFVLAIIVATYLPLHVPMLTNKIGGETLFKWVFLAGRKGLTATLFLIGSGLSIQAIKNVGIKPILQGILLWILIGGVSLWVIEATVR